MIGDRAKPSAASTAAAGARLPAKSAASGMVAVLQAIDSARFNIGGASGPTSCSHKVLRKWLLS